MKFSQMKYKRPNTEKMVKEYTKITEKFSACTTAAQQLELIYEHEKMFGSFQTMSTIAYIRQSINTVDPFYETEMAFYDSYNPVFQEYVQNFMKAVVASKFKKELEKETGKLFFKNIEISLKTFSPEIIDLMKEENALVTEYEKLLASAQIEFDGKALNLAEIHTYQVSQDRETRKNSWQKTAEFFTANSKKLDELYSKLVKSRTEQAKKLGYKNYVQLGYDRLGRNCYSPAEVKVYREQIVSDLVPVVTKIKKNQAERLGLPDIKFYDDANLFADGNPTPKGDKQALVDAAQKMYHEMNPQTGEFFDFMVQNELFDLDSKKGKAGGGYCTDIPDYKSPFIFANFNGTAGDVEVLTHEAGHAFASYVSRNMKIHENSCPTMEAAETHSMSMELLSRPWDEYFFQQDTEKFHVFQLETTLDFIPYGCMVDEFQETAYEKPDMTPKQRKKLWASLEKKYRPWIDFDNLEFFKDGGGYQRQHHIYSFPLYYIDYCLAQTVALEFWSQSNKNWEKAFENYLSFVSLGGTKTFVELVKHSKLNLPFNQGCIKALSSEILDWVEKHEVK